MEEVHEDCIPLFNVCLLETSLRTSAKGPFSFPQRVSFGVRSDQKYTDFKIWKVALRWLNEIPTFYT